ncbi:unnamed protein product, partial [Laminaria digitata]
MQEVGASRFAVLLKVLTSRSRDGSVSRMTIGRGQLLDGEGIRYAAPPLRTLRVMKVVTPGHPLPHA